MLDHYGTILKVIGTVMTQQENRNQQPNTVWLESFEEYNFRGFRGSRANHKTFPLKKILRGCTARRATPTEVHWQVVLLYTSLIQEAMALYRYLRPVNNASNLYTRSSRSSFEDTIYACNELGVWSGRYCGREDLKPLIAKSFVTTNL